jgi:hypothetical protein
MRHVTVAFPNGSEPLSANGLVPCAFHSAGKPALTPLIVTQPLGYTGRAR